MKYEIEVEKIEGTELYRVKGFNTIVFDEYWLSHLKPIDKPKSEFIVERKGEVKTSELLVGDKIKINLACLGEFTATVHEITRKGTLMIFDDCVCKRSMNETNTNEGGFEKSDLCSWMNTELLRSFPDEIRSRMVADENGNYLTVPTYGQIFGKDYPDDWHQANIEIDQREQLPLMKDRRNRIADLDGDYTWYWLQNVIRSSASFASVNGIGVANCAGASFVGGVRPVFEMGGETDEK